MVHLAAFSLAAVWADKPWLIFVIAAALFLAVVYGLLGSPQRDARRRDQEAREREMYEFFKRENDRHRPGPPATPPAP